MATNRQWILKKRPVGNCKEGDLELVTGEVPSVGDGQVLVKTSHVSIDPTHRIWMSDAPQYLAPVPLGDVMRALSVGVVEESKFEGLKKGDVVGGLGNVQDYFVADGAAVQKVEGISPEDSLGPFSLVIGLTAWYGTTQICKPKAGETFVVSGAAGAVGSLAGQLAKMAGARVIGTVGSADKAEWITKELGFDGAINYKTDNIPAKLKELAPDGVDCYFENTGGPVLEAVLSSFNNNARMALCGIISQYNSDKIGVKNFDMILHRRVTVRGFICMDHAEHMGDMLAAMKAGIEAGKIKYKLDVQDGLENYIKVVNMLYDGSNTGKLIIKV